MNAREIRRVVATFSFVVLGSVLVLAPVRAEPPAKIPIIYDSDIGDDIDDTWALVMALCSPELDVKLVVGDKQKGLYRAKLFAKLLEIAGRTDIPVGIAAGNREGGGRQSAWLGDYDLKSYPGKVYEDGVQAIIDTIMKSPEPITLVAVGPMPNIALALEREPRIAEKARFVGMHGSVRLGYGGNKKISAEYNVRADVKACQRVFTAPWDMTITPLDTCGLVHVRGAKYARVRDSKNPLAQALIANYRAWSKAHNHPAGAADKASSTLFDTVAVYLAFSETLLGMEELNIRVDDKGFTRIDPKAKKMRVAATWKDMGAFEDLLVERILGGPLAAPGAKTSFVPHRVGTHRSEACGVGDFNGDGKLDIVGGEFLYFAPDWQARKIRAINTDIDDKGNGYSWDFMNAPLDVDGDGRLDIVSCSWHGKRIEWYRNIGDADGLWPVEVVFENGNYECGELFDVDGDGKALEVMPHVQMTTWYEVAKTAAGGSRLVRHVVDTRKHTYGGGVGDVNGDGRPDILRPAAWYEAPPDIRKGKWKMHPLAVGHIQEGKIDHTPQIVVLDVNADGKNDIITGSAHKYGFFWYEQQPGTPHPNFKQHVIDKSWSQVHSITLADIDADGDLDVVTGKRFRAHNGGDPGANEPVGVYWYELDPGPSPKWTKHIISYDQGIGSGMNIPVVDMDADGDLDIVVTGKWGGPVWFENRRIP